MNKKYWYIFNGVHSPEIALFPESQTESLELDGDLRGPYDTFAECKKAAGNRMKRYLKDVMSIRKDSVQIKRWHSDG